MKEWKECKIQDICDKVISGGTPLTSNKDYYYPATIPWLKTGEVNYSYIYKTENFISEKGLKNSSAKLIPVNSIIVAMYGQGYTAGRVAVNKIPLSTNQACCNLQINEKIAHYAFVYYYLWTQYQQLVLYKTGGAQPNLNVDKIKKLKVQLPPLPTQKKIASILSAYDDLIQNYKKQIKALQTAASELYKEWFVRFRFPGYQTAKFENGLPAGWKVEKLENVANISTGKCNREDAEEDGIYPLFDRSQEIKKSNEWIKDCEAIIVPGEGTSFIPRYYKGKFNLHQRCYCVEPKCSNFGKFLFYVLMLNRKYFLSVATGATVPSLRYNNFASMKFVLPEISLCNRFNKLADCVFEKIDNLQQQISNLTQQRGLLLPRLMSGKLKIK